jgi:hypothetical protein
LDIGEQQNLREGGRKKGGRNSKRKEGSRQGEEEQDISWASSYQIHEVGHFMANFITRRLKPREMK